ncbi:hypothetical protein SEA_SCENTAE_228 [Gordonia phage SCentae]|nr:hypothetical protein SEA_SCENTAE_228 [Gordonia phage SCentae]
MESAFDPYARISPVPMHRMQVELVLAQGPQRRLAANLAIRAMDTGDSNDELAVFMEAFDHMKVDFEEKLREEFRMPTRAQQRKQEAMLRLRRRASAMFHDTYGEYQPPVRPWEEADWDLDNWPLEGIQG